MQSVFRSSEQIQDGQTMGYYIDIDRCCLLKYRLMSVVYKYYDTMNLHEYIYTQCIKYIEHVMYINILNITLHTYYIHTPFLTGRASLCVSASMQEAAAAAAAAEAADVEKKRQDEDHGRNPGRHVGVLNV